MLTSGGGVELPTALAEQAHAELQQLVDVDGLAQQVTVGHARQALDDARRRVAAHDDRRESRLRDPAERTNRLEAGFGSAEVVVADQQARRAPGREDLLQCLSQ